MPGKMETDTDQAFRLKTSREPRGPKRAGDKGTMGDQALMDALVIIGVAWAVLLVLAWSLRRHNV
jgi:hypothetical protein